MMLQRSAAAQLLSAQAANLEAWTIVVEDKLSIILRHGVQL